MTEREEAVYRNGIWAEREADQGFRNADRRAWFEGVKAFISAGDVRVGRIYPPKPSNIIRLPDQSYSEVCDWSEVPAGFAG